MPVSASYNNISQDLTVTGDGVSNAISVSRDAGGTLLVNNGAVPVTGGPATIANTDLIKVLAGLGNDKVGLDESNGVLPAANLSGGDGNDSLAGGSSGDSLFGDAGDDLLLGKAGNDQLFGGIGNDRLTGGTGNDTMNGEDGNDRMIWNPGDGSDVMEGGTGSDVAAVTGDSVAEVFAVTANGTRVRFDRVSPAPFVLDIGTTESLELNAAGGNDTISSIGNLAALIALTLNGGAGDDTILGGNGNDTILGGVGNDFVDGNQGNDVVSLGDGDDTFQWDPGDGSDTIEGEAGADLIVFNGNAANEIFALTANAGRVLATRDIGAVALDINGLEQVTINAGAGTDSINVNDLTGTDVDTVTINLAATIGGSASDAQIDQINVFATGGDDTIDMLGIGTFLSVLGLPALVGVNQLDANDAITINGGAGNDSISASALSSSNIAAVALNGGVGNDTISGSSGIDLLFGGDGDDLVDGNFGPDTAFLGNGNDIFKWDPGDASDVVEGQAGTDELLFNGSNASENIDIHPNGGRVLFTRDVAAITMDIDDIETIRYNAFLGADNVTVADMTGTDVSQVILNLAASVGGADGQFDRVIVQATFGADVVTVINGSVNVTGLAATTRIENSDAFDHLVISANSGDDVINASGLSAGQITLELLGGLGADVMIGTAGGDFFNGGDGNDTALMGAGDDEFTWNPGDDNDIVEGQTGIDRLDFNASAVGEGITISANGGRVLLFRDIGAVTMDLNDVEQITLNTGAGTDAVVVNDLSATDVDTITINLAGTIGGSTSDAQVDQITLFGGAGDETINVIGLPGSISVLGMHASVAINQLDATDRLTVFGGGGNDTINASVFSTGIAILTIDGGIGDDIISGTAAADTLFGGDGNDIVDGNQGLDTAFLGNGNDVFKWDPGDSSDVVEGQAGSDELFFNGSNASENINIQPNGGRAFFFRDVAAITMDMDDIETITYNALGGNDNINVGNLTGTDVTKVTINLAAIEGVPDDQADVVTVNATNSIDNVVITSTAPGVVTITGLSSVVEILNFDSKDRLVINAGTGDDNIDAFGLDAGLSLEVFAGDGNDIVRGGDGNDIVHGGPGTDTLLPSGGIDTFDGGGHLVIGG